MSVGIQTYVAMEAALLGAIELHEEGVGDAPASWLLSSELYRQLDYGGDHFTSSFRAIFYGEEPKQLYQLPVEIKLAAHHEWELRTG